MLKILLLLIILNITLILGTTTANKPTGRPLPPFDPNSFTRLYPNENFISYYRLLKTEAKICPWKPSKIDLWSLIAIDLFILFIFLVMILFGCLGHSHLRNYRKRQQDKEIAKQYGGHGDQTIMGGVGDNTIASTTIATTVA